MATTLEWSAHCRTNSASWTAFRSPRRNRRSKSTASLCTTYLNSTGAGNCRLDTRPRLWLQPLTVNSLINFCCRARTLTNSHTRSPSTSTGQYSKKSSQRTAVEFALKVTHVYEVRPRRDRRGFDLLSDALPFGGLWYLNVRDAIGYAEHYSRAHPSPSQA
jgi:hypothetical protein